MRSRAVRRPFLCCASMAFAPPHWRIRSSSFLISVSRSTICRLRFSKSADFVSGRLSLFVALTGFFLSWASSLQRPGRRGLPNHELYHPLSLLTWPVDGLESSRFETTILNRLPEEAGRYSRRFTLLPERA